MPEHAPVKPILLAAALLTLRGGVAAAAPVWAVSNAADAAYAELFADNGALLRRVSLGTGIDPHGIAVVGTTAYVSAAVNGATSTQSGIIRRFDTVTGVVGPDIVTSPLLGSLSFDGAGFWANDNGGGNKAFHVTLAGKTDAAVTLRNCSSYCSGLEYLTRNGASYLVANRSGYDASQVYDLYSLAGALVQAAVLTAANGTGIAYDSRADTFLVASSSGQDGDFGSVLTYSFGGTLLSSRALGGPVADSGFGTAVRYLTDLDALNPAAAVPEPASLALLAVPLAAFGLARRRA